jgi:hypothetical protein
MRRADPKPVHYFRAKRGCEEDASTGQAVVSKAERTAHIEVDGGGANVELGRRKVGIGTVSG